MKKIGVIIFFLIIFYSTYVFVKIKTNLFSSPKIIDLNQKIDTFKDNFIPDPTQILDNGLPDNHQIKTFFVPQAPEKKWDQPWQDACEEAAILTVDYYYQQITPTQDRILADFQKLFDFEAKKEFTHDVNLFEMASVAESLNYQSKIIESPTLEVIKTYISRNIPVIIPANGKILYQENKHFKSGGPWYHNLVILGYNDNTQKFTVHDVGTQFGAYYKYSYRLLMDSIHDFPDSKIKEEIDSGAPKVLVLIK